MRVVFIILLALLLTGCISGNVAVTPDGTCNADFISILKKVEAISFCGVDAINSDNRDDVIRSLVQALR